MKSFHPVQDCNAGVMNTASGMVVDLKNPTTDMIDIKDIANSLSKMCRFGGHTNQFYSVAQHSILVSFLMREGEGKYGLEALLHDASEAYLGDVVKPLKVILGSGYASMERRFENVIGNKYNLSMSPDCEDLVKKYDRQALELEHEAFQNDNVVPMLMTLEQLGLYDGHLSWNANNARIMFLACFAECMDIRDGKATDGYVSYISTKELFGKVG